MKNSDVAQFLNDIADVLDMQGEARFKVIAYQNAARRIDGLARFDVVTASIHGGLNQSRERITERMLSAIRNPHARRAMEAGADFAISSDSHSAEQLRLVRYGTATARRGWVEKGRVPNALPLDRLLDRLAKSPITR